MPRSERLDRTAWIDAALTAIAEHGVAGVAVEPLARRLKVTKGSGYWHFADRKALLKAALDAWEARHTQELFAGLGEEPDPERRLRLTFEAALSGSDARVYERLLASEEPAVRRAVARVEAHRVRFLEELFRQAGLPKRRAANRARLTYAAYVGLLHLLRGPDPRVEPRELRAFVEDALGTLLGGGVGRG